MFKHCCNQTLGLIQLFIFLSTWLLGKLTGEAIPTSALLQCFFNLFHSDSIFMFFFYYTLIINLAKDSLYPRLLPYIVTFVFSPLFSLETDNTSSTFDPLVFQINPCTMIIKDMHAPLVWKIVHKIKCSRFLWRGSEYPVVLV